MQWCCKTPMHLKELKLVSVKAIGIQFWDIWLYGFRNTYWWPIYSVTLSDTETDGERSSTSPHRSWWKSLCNLTPACAEQPSETASCWGDPWGGSERETDRKKNKHKQSGGSWGEAELRAHRWRPQFDLGQACPSLPLNAGWETHQAACRTWTSSMRKENAAWGKQRHGLPPPCSILLTTPFFFHFSTLIRFQHMAWPGVYTCKCSPQKILVLLLLFPLFTPFQTLIWFLYFFVSQQRGSFEMLLLYIS